MGRAQNSAVRYTHPVHGACTKFCSEIHTSGTWGVHRILQCDTHIRYMGRAQNSAVTYTIRYMGPAQNSACTYEFLEILPSDSRTLLQVASELLSVIFTFVNRFGRNSV